MFLGFGLVLALVLQFVETQIWSLVNDLDFMSIQTMSVCGPKIANLIPVWLFHGDHCVLGTEFLSANTSSLMLYFYTIQSLYKDYSQFTRWFLVNVNGHG